MIGNRRPKNISWVMVMTIAFAAALISSGQQPVAGRILTAKRMTNVIDSYPMLSPDGKKIAFQSNRTGNREIFVMNFDGTALSQLTNNDWYDGTPVWSPDGHRIVFTSSPNGDTEIFVMNANGTEKRRLTNSPGDDSHPKWSPDGSRIIFNSARTTQDLTVEWVKQVHEIFTMRADGTDVKQITALKTVSTYPSFSPDGREIVFRSIVSTPGFIWDLSASPRNSDILVMNSEGGSPRNVTNNAAFDGWGAWSPDGKQILFSSNRAGPANIGQLYRVNPDGSDLQQLTAGPGSFVQASWSRDGTKILAQQHWETEEFGNLVIFEMRSLRE